MANWEQFFKALGGGLGDFASYKLQRDRQKQEDADRAETRRLAQETLDETKRFHTESLAADNNERMQNRAQHRADQLYKAGLQVPDNFNQNALAAELPETPGYDAGGMAINALRTAGKARVGEFEAAGPRAINRLYAGEGLMEPVEGGGYAFMEPGTRANLDIAKQNAATAGLNRKATIEAALIRANATGRGRTDSIELQRQRIMDKEMTDLMKPPMNPITGLPTGEPGMSRAKAFREAKKRYDMIKANVDVPSGSDKEEPDSLASDHFNGRENAAFDPMAVANELKGLDYDTARSLLEAHNYTEQEIQLVLGNGDDEE